MPRQVSRMVSGMSVIVTGGARGIGRATVERFAGLGARVAVGDRDADVAAEVAAELGDRVVAAPLDISDPASWASFLTAVAHLEPFDVLVNNAGIMPLGPILEEDDAVTRAIFEVNVLGMINGVKAVAPAMVERGSGHIVNVSSAVGRVPVAGGASYSASKAAVVGFSEAIRGELAPSGVDVTLVLPSVVDTDLAAGVPAGRGMQRVTPGEVAEVIVSAAQRPRPELWVPRWVHGAVKVTNALPYRLQQALTKSSGDVLGGADFSKRQAYEEKVRGRSG